MTDKCKQPGDVLKNGFTVVEINSNAVLAHKKITETEGQYATWKFDYSGSTCWGHYFCYGEYSKLKQNEAYEEAYNDYLKR